MIEVSCAEPSSKNQKFPFLKNCLTNINQIWCVDGYTMQKYHFTKSGRSKGSALSYCLFIGKCWADERSALH